MARLGYHAMRLAWCRVALIAFLRRWAIYLLVGAALAGAASSGGVDAVRAIAAWSVLPLLHAAAGGVAPPLVLAIVAYAALAALLVRALRGLLWPARWAGAERALPLEPGETLRSDAVVVAWALGPLCLVYAVGAQALLAPDPPWLHGGRAIALVALGVVVGASEVAGVAVLRGLRRAGSAARGGRRRGGASSDGPASAVSLRISGMTVTASDSLRWPVAVVLLPLWRGPARRTGRALPAALALLGVPVLAIAWRPALTSWWLAAFALLAPAATARLRTLASDDFAALRRASVPLPLPSRSLDRTVSALPLLPVLVAAPALLIALPQAAGRWPVLVAFVVACVAAAAFEARRTEPAEPAATASRFLVVVAVLVALASEAIP